MRKKKSPIVEMTNQIYDEVQRHNVLLDTHKDSIVKLLEAVEWNIVKSNTFSNPHTGQALGLVRGALAMFSKFPK